MGPATDSSCQAVQPNSLRKSVLLLTDALHLAEGRRRSVHQGAKAIAVQLLLMRDTCDRALRPFFDAVAASMR
jgi:hypothetical protein